jgi:hypothetical protein
MNDKKESIPPIVKPPWANSLVSKKFEAYRDRMIEKAKNGPSASKKERMALFQRKVKPINDPALPIEPGIKFHAHNQIAHDALASLQEGVVEAKDDLERRKSFYAENKARMEVGISFRKNISERKHLTAKLEPVLLSIMNNEVIVRNYALPEFFIKKREIDLLKADLGEHEIYVPGQTGPYSLYAKAAPLDIKIISALVRKGVFIIPTELPEVSDYEIWTACFKPLRNKIAVTYFSFGDILYRKALCLQNKLLNFSADIKTLVLNFLNRTLTGIDDVLIDPFYHPLQDLVDVICGPVGKYNYTFSFHNVVFRIDAKLFYYIATNLRKEKYSYMAAAVLCTVPHEFRDREHFIKWFNDHDVAIAEVLTPDTAKPPSNKDVFEQASHPDIIWDYDTLISKSVDVQIAYLMSGKARPEPPEKPEHQPSPWFSSYYGGNWVLFNHWLTTQERLEKPPPAEITFYDPEAGEMDLPEDGFSFFGDEET